MADGRIEIDTRINDSGLQTGLRDIQNSLQGTGKKMKAVGKNLTAFVTTPILGLGTAAVLAGANFEEGMSKVAAISGATEGELKKLEDQAKFFGATTKFSATEAADGMSFLAMAGFKTNDILDAMPGMLSLAAAGALELGAAADITSNIMSGFGIEASKSGHVADVLAYAASNANTDVSQLGEAMKYLAPSAKTLGWSIEESTAAVMAFGDAGIQGGMAGQAFASSMSRLAKPTTKMQGLMDDLGIEFFDAEDKMKSMPELIGHLEEKMDGLTPKQKAAAISTLFGAEAFKHWATLLEKGSDELDKNTKALEKADGAADKMAKKMADNAKGDFKTFMSALEGMAIIIYEKLRPSIREFIQFITNLVRKFEKLSPTAQNIILIIAGIAAAIGPVILLAGLFASAIGALIPVIGAISLPVVAVIAAIVAFGAALVAAYMQSEEFRNKVNTIFNAIKDIAVQVFEAVVTFIQEKIAQIKQFWDEHGTQILEAVTNVFNGIKSIIEFIMPAVLLVVDFVWSSIKQVINGALNIIMGLVKVFTGLFTADWGLLWEGIMQLLGGAIEFILGLMNLSFLGGIKKILVSLAKSAGKTIAGMAKNIIGFFKGLWTNSVNAVNGMATGVVKWFTNIYTKAQSVFGTLRTFGASIFNSIKQTIVNIAQGIWQGFTSKISSMAASVKHTFQGIWSTAKSIFGKVKDAITKPIETAKSVVKAAIDKIKGFFSNMKVKIPMPHFDFSVGSKEIAGIKVPFPKVNVDWYAKGALFPANSPRLVGIGDNKQYQEAALPLSPNVLGFIANKISDHMPQGDNGSNGGNTLPDNMEARILIGGHETKGLIKFITKEQNGLKTKASRGLRGN